MSKKSIWLLDGVAGSVLLGALATTGCGAGEVGPPYEEDPLGTTVGATTGSTGATTGAGPTTGSGPSGSTGTSSTGAGGSDSGTTSTSTSTSASSTTGSGGGSCGGPAMDQNGVAYVELPGFTYEGGVERFDWSENFQGDSMRHDFEHTEEGNQCTIGYFLVDGPDDEEISAKLGGGPHNNDNADWADTHDLGVIDFAGSGARLRWEETHPDYSDSMESPVSINIGDIRGKWTGAMGCKLNVDEDKNGEIDTIWYLSFVDPEGLDAQDKPINGWVKVFDLKFPIADVGLKSPEIPYVVTIGEGVEAQATMRIDGQGDGYDYKYIAYRSPVACTP